jgi:isochorismate hydrolase
VNKQAEGRFSVSDKQSSESPLLAREDSLLVIIDMQERLLPVIAEKEKIIENVVKLVKFSHIIGLPVVLTEQQKLGETVPEIGQMIKGVQPISKLEFDCFGSGDFAKHVREQNKGALIITGVEAHVCVAQTALSGLSEYTVHVVSDAISSRSLHNREVALHRMNQNGVTITSTEMVIYELLGKAGTDTFREALALVK